MLKFLGLCTLILLIAKCCNVLAIGLFACFIPLIIGLIIKGIFWFIVLVIGIGLYNEDKKIK